MKVLVLYDIHGNSDALEAVLADPRAAARDAIVVGGDAVPGAFGHTVVDRVDALTLPVHHLRGNGERETAEAVEATRPPADDDLAAVTAAITAAELGADRARALGELPLIVRLDGVLYCHATPRADDEMVTRASAPERYAEVLADVDAPVVVAGHTHQQDDRMVGPVRFVTRAASVCRTRAMGLRAGCGWSTAFPSCAPHPTTRWPPGPGCSRLAGPTSGRCVAPSSIPSRQALSRNYSSN